jgi:uncharacterized membrane protein YtjA (UPF0391 family)
MFILALLFLILSLITRFAGSSPKKTARTGVVRAVFMVAMLLFALSLLAGLVGARHFIGGRQPWS